LKNSDERKKRLYLLSMGCLKMDISDQYFTALKVVKETSRSGENTRAGGYRFGFNGMEADDEIAGVKNSYTAEYWQYDPRIGRRWNTDPVFKPWESRYACFSSNPVLYTDPRGLDPQKRAEKYASKHEISKYKLYENINTGRVWLIYSYTDKSAEKASVIVAKVFDYNVFERIGHALRWGVNKLTGNSYGPNKKRDATTDEELLIKTFDQDMVKEMGETYGDSKIGGTNRNTVITDASYEGEREEEKEKEEKKKEGGNLTKVILESDIKEKVNEQSRQVHGKEINYFIARTTHGTRWYYETTTGANQTNYGDTLKFIGEDYNSSDSIWIVPKEK